MSSPDILKFFAVLAGHDKVSDAGSVTSCRRKFKDALLQTESTKNEGPSENRGLIRKTVWRFQKKKNKNNIHDLWKSQVEHKGVNWLSPLNKAFISSKNYTKQNLRKAIKWKLLELGKTRTKKSIPDIFNFWQSWPVMTKSMTLAALHLAGENSKMHHYKQNVNKNEGPSENRGLIRKTVWRFQKKIRTETLFKTFQKTQWNTRESLNESTEQSLHEEQELN